MTDIRDTVSLMTFGMKRSVALDQFVCVSRGTVIGPDVPTTAGLGHVSGRIQPFALVTVREYRDGLPIRVEVSWDTLAHILNTKGALAIR